MMDKKYNKKKGMTRWLSIFGIAISGLLISALWVSAQANDSMHSPTANYNDNAAYMKTVHSGALKSSTSTVMNQSGQPIEHPPLDGLLRDLQQRFPAYSTQQVILVDTTIQRLMLIEYGQVVSSWVISTAEAGLGNLKGSNKTPLGVHRVAKRYGDGAPLGAIFKARRNTGRVAEILTAPGVRSQADNVTTRILWLDGLEPGLNKGGKVDSFERYIYIHGTDEEGRLGAPASHGCIRMSNRDVVDLYQRVGVDTLVVMAQRR